MQINPRIKDETEPVADDEWLLRRVRFEKFRVAKAPCISPNAFEPRIPGPKVRDPDLSGISLYRAACLENPERILDKVSPDKRSEFGIVGVPISLLKELGLTVVVEPDSREPIIPGHVVVPELGAALYEADKARFAAIKLRLAEVASENILRSPTMVA